MTENCTRFTLRDLPLPAKLVVTAFLLAVGLGYCSAMVQLHFQHAGPGNVVPTPEDVIEKFSGQHAPWVRKKLEATQAAAANAPVAEGKMVDGARIKSIINERCNECHGKDGEKEEVPLDTYAGIRKLLDTPPEKGKFHKVIAKENEGNFNKDNMVPAFTLKSKDPIDGEDVEWKKLIKLNKDRPEELLRAERETERKVLIAWLEVGAPEEHYNIDAFPLPASLREAKFTARFKVPARELSKAEVEVAKNRKNPKDRQMSVESLTQSTHAHLLSFSMLWALTGIIFAFTSYSTFTRCVLAPIVLIAQVADIACWWLARLPGDTGCYFALAILGTGGVVGIGLTLQIVLSLFNMHLCGKKECKI